MGVKLIPVFLVVFGLLGAAFFWYYNNTQQRISILTENNAKLQAVTETQKATISSLEASAAATAANISDLQTKLQAAEEAGRKIAGLLAETDIVKNSIANPEATETKINEEINLMFDSISALTK
jgi:cell division protein FtsB